MRGWPLVVFFIYTIISNVLVVDSQERASYDDPILPFNFEANLGRPSRFSPAFKGDQFNKVIPKEVWVAYRNIPRPAHLPDTMRDFMEQCKRDKWNYHFLDMRDQLEFLQIYYPKTSVLWAFEHIHEEAWLAATDIFRYAMLHAFGGLFMHQFGYLNHSLNSITSGEYDMIIARSDIQYKDPCYRPNYALSTFDMRKNYDLSMAADILHEKALVTWAIFSVPGHPILLRVLKNLVDVVKQEYIHKSVIHSIRRDPNRFVHCATGKFLFTSSVMQAILEDPSNKQTFKLLGANFEEYGGKFSTPRYEEYGPLLREYQALNAQDFERMPYIYKGIYLIINGTRHLFPDMATLHAHGFTTTDLRHVWSVHEFENIPLGTPLPSEPHFEKTHAIDMVDRPSEFSW